MRGGGIGGAGAGVVILSGGSGGVGAASLGGGMLAGLFLTKGGEVVVNPGARLPREVRKTGYASGGPAGRNHAALNSAGRSETATIRSKASQPVIDMWHRTSRDLLTPTLTI
jgi:hypothetical protein